MTIAPLHASSPAPADKPEKIRDAARQFESLLISQMLKDAREARTEEDQTTTSISEMAEQQLASAMSAGGGIGLASLIVKGLNHQSGENGASMPSARGSV